MALIFTPTTVPMEWRGVFQAPTLASTSSPRPSDKSDDNSLNRTDSSHSGSSAPEKPQAKSLRSMFGKSSKNKALSPPPIPEIGSADDRLPYHNDGPRYNVELTPTELSDDISISRMSTIGGSSLSSGASYIDSPAGAHPPNMSEKLMRVFGAKAHHAASSADRAPSSSDDRPVTRKRDSILSTSTKQSSERPPTSAGPAMVAAAPKWEPPPFFKGLSGAVKHGSLMTCGVTANAIIYLSTHDKNGKFVARPGGFGEDPVKAEKAKEKHRQRVIENLGKAEWTRKIYVLTSSGHLLQFSCDGAFNRPPEQSIRLSRHSVAFASDVIPGRHWVLQITTVYDALSKITAAELSPNPAAPPKQRPGSKSTYIKPIKQFLLVMDNGEELDSWLTAVRHEIEALAAPKPDPEAAVKKTDEEENRRPASAHSSIPPEMVNSFPTPSIHEPLHSMQPTIPSLPEPHYPPPLPTSAPHQEPLSPPHRPSPLPQEALYPPHSTSPPIHEPLYPPRRLSPFPQEPSYSSHQDDETEPQSWASEAHTSVPSRAANTLSSVTSAKSIEEHLLDSLRDSNTYSHPRSSGARTFLTSPSPSRGSSPANSPLNESFPAEDDEVRYGFGEFGQHRPGAAGIRERRQSLQGGRAPALDAVLPPRNSSLEDESGVPTPTNDAAMMRRMARRTPPATLMTRLSIVEDQPSPDLPSQSPAPAISPKSRARAQRANIPVPPRSARRQSSLISNSNSPSSPIARRDPHELISSSPPPSPTTSDDEFQFHHWTSRLSPPPAHGGASPSLSNEELAALGGPLSPTPPPLPLFSYPFPTNSPPPQDTMLTPAPLAVSPHTARANAYVTSTRDKRTSIGLGREKRDSISLIREKRRPMPPKPLASRTYITVPHVPGDPGYNGEGRAGRERGYSGSGSYAGNGGYGAGGYGASGYGGYNYGGLGGGVTTGRVMKGAERIVTRDRGSIDKSVFDRSGLDRYTSAAPTTVTGERPTTREGRPKSRKAAVAPAMALPPLAPPPTRGLPPVPGGRGQGRGTPEPGWMN